MRDQRWLSVAMLSLGLVACGGGSGGKKVSGPCTRGELSGCGVACGDASGAECGAGLFCEASQCTAECTSASYATDCGENAGCTIEGRCVLPSAGDGGGVNGGTNQSTGDGGGSSCGEVKLDATPKTPNVIVIVDQSGSMDADFGSSNRWEVLKDSLLADNGLFAELQSLVRFGLVLYSGANDDDPTCPALVQVDVAINNLDAIKASYEPEEIKNDTPTGDSIEAILNQIEGTDLVNGKDPTIFVLATDGEPDTCAEPNPQNGQEEAVAAVTRAYGLGIRTYLIAVAEEDELSQDHLTDMANAGVGVQAGQADAPSYRVNDDAGLRSALRGIVAGELSCIVPLKGKVTASDPCVGTVKLDGTALECNSDNGWKLVTESSIEITGTACETLKTGKQLEATFPCGSAVGEII